MAAPTDSARQGTNVTAAATTHNVNVGSPVAGTLLIVFARWAADPGSVQFTGYERFTAFDSGDASDDMTTLFWRRADGTEGATDPLTTGNSVKAAYICWEITGAEDPFTSPPFGYGPNTGTTVANTANGPSATVAAAPRDTLYLACAGGDGEVGAYTAAPASYGNLITANSGTGGAVATNCFLGGASRQILASTSDDPGVFTHGAHVTGWMAYTVAIAEPHVYPRYPAINHQNPAVLMKGLREAWDRRRSGILVPRLWLPEGAVI